MKQDEFKNRYMIKLSSSVVLAVLNMVIQFLLPRAFTVEEYGYYTYNLNVFTSVVGMAMLSAPNALIAKFSKRNDEIGLVSFYLKFYLAVILCLNVGVIVLYRAGLLQKTFTGQTLFVVLLAMESAAVLRLQTDSIGIFDAMAISRFPAVMQIVLKVFISVAVIAGYLLGKLNLKFFYSIQILLTFLITCSLLYEIIKEQKARYPVRLDFGSRAYFKEYYEFCRPLVISSIISQVLTIFMNWALMRWSGATAQAMFGAAWQLNTLVSYVFSPYAELSKREFAVVCGDRDILRYRYVQALKLMLWITSYFALFIGIMSEWLLPIVYGDKYAGAELVTILIMFYTVYQAGGQISGAFFLATERTKISATLGIASQLVTLAAVFVFQIPNFIWRESLGSVGIALTYLIPNIISTGMGLHANSRMLEMPFIKNWFIRIPPLVLCSVTAFALKHGFDLAWKGTGTGILVGKVILAGLLYTAVIGSVVWLHPQFLGVTKESIRNLVKVGDRKQEK